MNSKEEIIIATSTTLTNDNWSAICLTCHQEGPEWGFDRYAAREDGFDYLGNHPDHYVVLD